jgi:CHAT domain-containing protein
LYDLLIAPLRSALPRTPGALLTIVPHGPLHRLSFAGLAAPGGRYLVEDFRIHYAPSIGVLRASAPPRPSSAASRVVVVSNPRLPADLARRSDLPPLPGALAEGRAVAREIGKLSVVSLTGQSASEARVRQEVPPADVLHFATHGVVRDDSPFESFLALASDHTHDSRDDGRLTTAEVYDLRLDADMVVLSACRSASGPVTGDGVMGLTRAFTYAGAPSVVASLWDLPDEAARVVIPRFYRVWRAGGARADALRLAQIQLLRALRAGLVAVDTPAGRLALPEHPAIWAGLVLLGQP